MESEGGEKNKKNIRGRDKQAKKKTALYHDRSHDTLIF